MQRPSRALVALVAVLVVGASIPASAAAADRSAPTRETVTFVSRAELIRLGLIEEPERSSTRLAPNAFCLFDCIDVRNRRFVRTVKPFVTFVQGNGPGSLSMDITRTVRNSFTATVQVSGAVVSAGVGFDVELAESVGYRYSTTVPAGACWVVRAYDVFSDYSFEVWQEPFLGADQRIGSGRALSFQGIEFRLAKSC